MKKTITTLLILLTTILILAGCQNSIPISSFQDVEHSITVTSSSTGTPEPKKTMTPTLSEVKQTARATNPTKFAVFETYSVSAMETQTAIANAVTSKELICRDDYDIAPFYGWEHGINAFSTTNDTWSIIACIPEQNSTSFGYTKLVNKDSSREWKINYENFGILSNTNSYLHALEYDEISHDLYFDLKHNAFPPDGGYTFRFSNGYLGLYRINLDTGEFSAILPYTESESYADMAFDPEMNYLVYQKRCEPNEIVVINLKTNEIIFSTEIDEEVEISGRFFWSETDPIVIYAAGYPGWDNGANDISIYRLNLDTKTNIELVHNDMRALIPFANDQTGSIWLDETTITLISIYEETDYWYQMNIQTGEVTKLSVEENK